jgi:hypothetical protein
VRPYLKKKTLSQRAGGVAQGVGRPEFKSHTAKKKKNQNRAGCGPSPQEAEAGEWRVLGQPGLHSETLCL